MVGRRGAHDAGATGGRLRDAQGQIVGLATGAGHGHGVERVVEHGCQFLSIIDYARMQIAGVGIECARLLAYRLDHAGMTVTDVWDVVIGVQIAPPPVVPHPHAGTTHQRDGLAVES